MCYVRPYTLRLTAVDGSTFTVMAYIDLMEKTQLLGWFKQLLRNTGLTSKWNSRKAKEVIEYIRADAPTLWDRPPLEVLNLANGLLDVKNKQFRPHGPEHLTSIQLPVKYNSQAKMPEVFSPDAR